MKNYLVSKTKQKTVPNVFINGNHVGGYDDTVKAHKQGNLIKLINGNLYNLYQIILYS
jgi:glutaredoxin